MLRKALSIVPFALALAFAANDANATVAVPLSFDALTKQSDVVVIATVVESTSFWAPNKERIYTHTKVLVLRSLKGLPKTQSLVVRQWGGQVGGVRMDVPGNANLKTGEEVVLFLSNDETFHYVVGLAQGKFTLQADSTGKKLASRNLAGLAFAQWNKGKMTISPRWELSKPLALDELEAEVKRASATTTPAAR